MSLTQKKSLIGIWIFWIQNAYLKTLLKTCICWCLDSWLSQPFVDLHKKRVPHKLKQLYKNKEIFAPDFLAYVHEEIVFAFL